MSLSILILCLASSLGWSLFDLSRKKVSSQFHPIEALLYYMIFTLPLFGVWFFFESNHFSKSYWLIGLPGILINFVANLSFIESVKRSPLSSTVPLLSFIPAGAAIFSFVFLGESLTTLQILGIFTVVVGSLILNGKVDFAHAESKGILYMLVAALGWSAMIVVDKVSLKHASLPVHASIQTIGIALIAIYLIFQKKLKLNYSALKIRGQYFWLGVLGAFAGIGLQLVVLPMADVGIVETLKRSGNMSLSLVWGKLFFAEQIDFRKILALIVLSIGVLMVLNFDALGL